MRNDSAHQLYKFDTNPITKFQDGGQNGGRARQGNSIRRVNKGEIDGTNDLLDGDTEIKRRLIDRRNMMTTLS